MGRHTFGWGEVTGGEMTMGRNDRKPCNHFAHHLCGGGARSGEIQHSETRLFLFGMNYRSVTLSAN